MNIIPTGEILGATINGLDLTQPLTSLQLGSIIRAITDHGVVCFRDQNLTPGQQAAFSRHFGTLEVHVSGVFQDHEHPEVMTLSNIVEGGRPIGLSDAGQDWHTDMSFSRMIAFVNVLHARRVPVRDGRVLGDTLFASMTAAYDTLAPEIQARIENLTATHDFEKFWEMMRRRKGAETQRAPLTDAQRQQKPPVSHPLVMRHPISGRKILYADPGYTVRIDGVPANEGDELLTLLFTHQIRPEFQYAHHWREGDVLVWDNLQTVHTAVSDYGPDEPRLVRRCQAMADRVFQPAFKALADAAP